MRRSITGEPPLTAVYPPDQGVIPGRNSVATLLQGLREQTVVDGEGINQSHARKPFIPARPSTLLQQQIAFTHQQSEEGLIAWLSTEVARKAESLLGSPDNHHVSPGND